MSDYGIVLCGVSRPGGTLINLAFLRFDWTIHCSIYPGEKFAFTNANVKVYNFFDVLQYPNHLSGIITALFSLVGNLILLPFLSNLYSIDTTPSFSTSIFLYWSQTTLFLGG